MIDKTTNICKRSQTRKICLFPLSKNEKTTKKKAIAKANESTTNEPCAKASRAQGPPCTFVLVGTRLPYIERARNLFFTARRFQRAWTTSWIAMEKRRIERNCRRATGHHRSIDRYKRSAPASANLDISRAKAEGEHDPFEMTKCEAGGLKCSFRNVHFLQRGNTRSRTTNMIGISGRRSDNSMC